MRTTSFLLALAVVVPSLANPLHMRLRRDSVAPPITNPTAGTVWRAGETQMITWYVPALDLQCLQADTSRPKGCRGFARRSPVQSSCQDLSGHRYPARGGEVHAWYVDSQLSAQSCHGSDLFPIGDPLASGFPILGGNVNLTVPSVPSGDNYFVCGTCFTLLLVLFPILMTPRSVWQHPRH